MKNFTGNVKTTLDGRQQAHSMSRKPPKLRALAAGISAAMLFTGLGGHAAAQQQEIEEIQITGTRILRSGAETPTPVTIMNVTELNNMQPGNLIDSLSQLPQFYSNITPRQVVGGQNSGGSNVNLRGAGVNRTLVLLNGRRMVPSNRFGTVDVGTFPEQLIQSVESVTGGASASYGTDAVAGVVNFILDTDFTGFKASGQAGTTRYNDGQNVETGFAFGTPVGDRFHMIGSAEFFRQSPIDSFESLRERDYQLRARVTNPDPNGPTQIIRSFVKPTNYTPGGIINQPGSSLHKLEFLPNGRTQPLPFSGVGQLNGGCNCYVDDFQRLRTKEDFGIDQDNEVAPGSRRTSAFFYGDYDAADSFTAYTQVLYANTHADDRRESIALLGPWQGRVFADNPFMPPDVRQTMEQEGLDSVGFGIFTPNRDGTVLGESRLAVDNWLYTGTLGFDAEMTGGFLAGWQVEGYAQYGYNRQDIHNPAGIRVDRLFFAMDATEDEFGRPTCTVTLANPDKFDDCVPINLFGGISNITPEAANYIVDDGKITRQKTQQRAAEIVFNGEISQGFGSGPILGAFGASYREEELTQETPDPSDEFPATMDNVLLSDLGLLPEGLRGVVPENEPGGIPGLRHVPPGFKGDSNSSSVLFSSLRTITGKFDVKEFFGEVSIPLLSSNEFAEQLDFDAAARWADYEGSGSVWAWKYGLSWQVTDAFRVRATQSRDVRAATLQERFDQTRGGTSVQDPENNFATINTASFSGGNPNVNPEAADTTTIGIAYQPYFLEGMSITADWYNIELEDAIGSLGSQNIVDGCFGGDQSLCQFVHRNQDNQIVRVDNLFINLAEQKITGVDFELNYNRDINLLGGGETVGWRLFTTWLDENSVKNPDAPRDDRAGEVGGFSLPEWKVTTNLTYLNGPVSAFLQGRWIDGGLLSRNLVEGVDIDDNTVSSVFYTDFNLRYTSSAGNLGSEWEAFLNISNLFDRDPPPAPGGVGRTGTNEFNTSLHDIFGRRYTAGVRLNF